MGPQLSLVLSSPLGQDREPQGLGALISPETTPALPSSWRHLLKMQICSDLCLPQGFWTFFK